MRKLVLILSAFVYVASQFVRADEGMWLPFLLNRNYEDMKKHGLHLTADEIYSINHSSLKDAVISFGGFCTGEIISNSGLILTNHHCGFDAIATASSKEHNYLDSGFWAKNYQEEIPVPGLTATFMISMKDVSAEMLKELNPGMTAKQRADKIREISDILTKDATRGTNYEAFVRDFYDGNEFYLFVKETYKDVRIVGTPPQSAGKFGGDTDNWMWPRHTADFSMFRVYAGADNKPAAFDKANIPMKPKYSLPISIKGVKEGDFAMIMGFPGRTNRYLTSYGVEQAVAIEQPKIVDIRAKKLEIMKKYMDKDVDVRLNYSSKYAQVANYWKYFIGQSQQLTNNHVADKKRAIEAEFTKYSAGKPEYDNVLNDIEKSIKDNESVIYIRTYQSEFVRQVDINSMVYILKVAADAEKSGNAERAKQLRDMAFEQAETFFKERDMRIELETLEDVLKMYIKDVPMSREGALTRNIGENGVAAFMSRVKMYSVFVDQKRFEDFKANFSIEKLQQDPMFVLIKSLDDAYQAAMSDPEIKQASEKLSRANRLFVDAVRKMQPNKKFYPNANSTMRLTYGNVLSYTTNEGKYMGYLTDFDGVVAKEDPTNPEFRVDPKMKETWQKKDFGPYLDQKTGKLPVNFLTNNDITGGNSGSPVINGYGQLIGTAFDGNWEAMSGDIYFEPNIQRTISLDIRYTLWIIDKVYGAHNLVQEMKIVK